MVAPVECYDLKKMQTYFNNMNETQIYICDDYFV